MGAVNALLIFTGYWLLAYGVATVRSCNVKLLDIALPGHYKGCNPDSSSGSSTTPPPTKPAVGLAPPTTSPIQAPPKGSTAPPRDYNPGQVGPQQQI